MAGPFVFIGTHRIQDGKLEDFKRDMGEFSRFVEGHEPRLIAFNVYLDEQGEEVAVVQVHPDMSSMETHLRVVHEHIQKAYADTLEKTTSIQIYGALTADLLATLKQLASSDTQFIIQQEHLAGFTRSSAQTASATI